MARTAVTGIGHWATSAVGSAAASSDAVGLALGDALLLGGEFAVGRTVGDDVGVALLEVDALALGSGEAVTLGSADAVSSVVGELDGSIAIERDSSEADCDELGDVSSIVDGEADGVSLTRGLADTDAGVVALALALALAVPDALALAEGSISG